MFCILSLLCTQTDEGERVLEGLRLSLNLNPVGPECAAVPNEQRKACPEAWPKTAPKQQSCQSTSQRTKTWVQAEPLGFIAYNSQSQAL